jgi:outer membrane protein
MAAALTIMTGISAATAAEVVSTLPELVAAALAVDEQVARAESALRRTDANVRLARSVLLPRLELNGAYTRYQDEQAVDFAPGETFVIRPRSDWNWSADLNQTVFSGLRDWRAKDVARLNHDAAELDLQVARDDLVLRVAISFYDTVAAEQRVDIRRAALDQIAKQLHVAERRFEVGEAASAEVARWRAEVASANQQLVVAAGDAELTRRRLARLTGVDDLGRLQPPGPIPIPDGTDVELVDRALTERLEMAALAHQLEAAGLFVKIEKGAWLPELDVHAQYFKQKAAFPSQDSTSIAVTAKVPIYDGGLTAARVAQAREDLAEVELLGREVSKTIADQVESSAITFRAASAALDAARERRVAASEAHRQVERAYRVGEASSLDLLEVTSERIDADNSFVIARAQRQLEAIALRRAIGQPPIPESDSLTSDVDQNQE